MLPNGQASLILSTKETEKQEQSQETKVAHEGSRHEQPQKPLFPWAYVERQAKKSLMEAHTKPASVLL